MSTLYEKTQEIFRKIKVLGIIIAILMILLGIVSCFSPLLGESIVIWLMVISLFIYGLEEIITFFASPKGNRDGFSLAIGIIWVVLCLLLFLDTIFSNELDNLFKVVSFNYFLAILVSFSCIFDAVRNFCLAPHADELESNKGGMILIGVLELLAGITILSFPVGSIITLTTFFSIFILVEGVALLIRCLTFKPGE